MIVEGSSCLSNESELSVAFRDRVLGYEDLRNRVQDLIAQYKDRIGQDVVRSYSSRIKEERRFLKKAPRRGYLQRTYGKACLTFLASG